MHHHHLLDRDLPIFPAVFSTGLSSCTLKHSWSLPLSTPAIRGSHSFRVQHGLMVFCRMFWGGPMEKYCHWGGTPRFGRNEQFGKVVIFQNSMSLSLNLSLRVYNVVEHTVRWTPCLHYIFTPVMSYHFTNICFVVQVQVVFFWH